MADGSGKILVLGPSFDGGADQGNAGAVTRREPLNRVRLRYLPTVVYHRCMSRTNIDIDDELCQQVMDRFHLATKREAVNLALQRLAGEPLNVDDARSLRGSGWDGDLDAMRTSRT